MPTFAKVFIFFEHWHTSTIPSRVFFPYCNLVMDRIPKAMDWEIAFSDFLTKKYNQIRRKNPRYSLRSFANALDVSVGALSETMSKKRFLSLKRSRDILNKISAPTQEKNRLLTLMGFPIETEPEKQELTDNHHRLISDILCTAFLAFLDLSFTEKSAEGASRHFCMDPSKAQEIFDYLLAKNLITENGGTYKTNTDFVRTTDGVPTTVLRQRHVTNLNLAANSIEAIDLTERDVTASSFAGSRAQLELLRKEIRLLHAKASAIMEVEPRDEIYQMVVAIHPINAKVLHGD